MSTPAAQASTTDTVEFWTERLAFWTQRAKTQRDSLARADAEDDHLAAIFWKAMIGSSETQITEIAKRIEALSIAADARVEANLAALQVAA